MENSAETLAGKLLSESQRTIDYFRGLTPEQWEIDIYTEGSRWTIGRILFHLVNAEQGNLQIVKNIIKGGAGVPENFDIDHYNEVNVSNQPILSPELLIKEFENNRLETIEKVRSLSSADLVMIGRHPFLGLAKVEDIVKLIYLHTQLHIRDVKNILNANLSSSQ